MNLFLISIFGILGILARYAIDKILNHTIYNFPVSTLLVNILGSLVLGVLVSLFQTKYSLSHPLFLPLTIGLCGGFTTFSSYTLQVLSMIDSGEVLKAISYFIISPIFGLLAAYLGHRISNNFILHQ